MIPKVALVIISNSITIKTISTESTYSLPTRDLRQNLMRDMHLRRLAGSPVVLAMFRTRLTTNPPQICGKPANFH